MKLSVYALILTATFALALSACKRPADPVAVVEPVDLTKMRYKHDFYASEAECRRRNPNYEISCSEWVDFRDSVRADLLLGGGDIIISGSYLRTPETIIIKLGAGLPQEKEIVFKVISDMELTRSSDGTRWVRY